MDYGTRLAIGAIVRGLHRGGIVGGDAIAAIINSLMLAKAEAESRCRAADAEQIAVLADDVREIATGHRSAS